MASKLLKVSKNFTAFSKRFISNRADYERALGTIPPTEQTSLDNKVRVVCQTKDTDTTTVGIWILSGSRFEEQRENGVGNLLQILINKSIGKKIEESNASGLGASFYSFVDREQTAYYATCLNKDVPKVVEILSDAVTNPKITDQDIAEARKFILPEYNNIEGDFRSYVLESLHSVAFQGTPLGQTIIGPRQNVESFSSNDLKSYIETHFKGPRTVLAAAGGVSLSELTNLAGKSLSKLETTFQTGEPLLMPCRFTGSDFRFRDDSIDFAHFALAVQGPGFNSPDRLPIAIANEVIGTYDRSLGKTADDDSYDLAHIVDQFNITYSDTGLFGAYIACEIMQADEMAFTLMNAWKNICFTITDAKLEVAKKNLIRKLLIEQSGTKGSCEAIGRSILGLEYYTPLNELILSIENCSNDLIRSAAEKYIQNQTLVVAGVGPLCNLSDYVNLQIQMRLRRI